MKYYKINNPNSPLGLLKSFDLLLKKSNPDQSLQFNYSYGEIGRYRSLTPEIITIMRILEKNMIFIKYGFFSIKIDYIFNN